MKRFDPITLVGMVSICAVVFIIIRFMWVLSGILRLSTVADMWAFLQAIDSHDPLIFRVVAIVSGVRPAAIWQALCRAVHWTDPVILFVWLGVAWLPWPRAQRRIGTWLRWSFWLYLFMMVLMIFAVSTALSALSMPVALLRLRGGLVFIICLGVFLLLSLVVVLIPWQKRRNSQ